MLLHFVPVGIEYRESSEIFNEINKYDANFQKVVAIVTEEKVIPIHTNDNQGAKTCFENLLLISSLFLKELI